MEKTYLQVAQEALDRVTKANAVDGEKYGIQPGHQELLDIAKTAALIDIAASLLELQLIAQRKELR